MSVSAEQLICAECIGCGHVWIVMRAPLLMRDAAKLANNAKACPMCARPKPVVAKTARVAELLADGKLGAITEPSP